MPPHSHISATFQGEAECKNPEQYSVHFSWEEIALSTSQHIPGWDIDTFILQGVTQDVSTKRSVF